MSFWQIAFINPEKLQVLIIDVIFWKLNSLLLNFGNHYINYNVK
jgi:hypothetical protein